MAQSKSHEDTHGSLFPTPVANLASQMRCLSSGATHLWQKLAVDLGSHELPGESGPGSSELSDPLGGLIPQGTASFSCKKTASAGEEQS